MMSCSTWDLLHARKMRPNFKSSDNLPFTWQLGNAMDSFNKKGELLLYSATINMIPNSRSSRTTELQKLQTTTRAQISERASQKAIGGGYIAQ